MYHSRQKVSITSLYALVNFVHYLRTVANKKRWNDHTWLKLRRNCYAFSQSTKRDSRKSSENPRCFFSILSSVSSQLRTPACFAQIWIRNVIHSTAKRCFLATNNFTPFHDYRISMFIPSHFAQRKTCIVPFLPSFFHAALSRLS